ncbi:hypothetical protein N7447_008490 [Penicillium robsamsonii]|uniref:uncharacterized protein n=1 Tax=Penicillium robsamsonii TaxID=1792511 RepID=UPI002546B890|nr:uncharacterized protein N7447_008490 [Penicillium robsamsonii]KAJ5816257.1 hypothetical protein N7447_008490 [Penicillium robsamsonii]
MSEPTSSPIKRIINRFRRGSGHADGGDDTEVPPPATPKKKDRKRKGDNGDDDPSPPAAKRPATGPSGLERARRKLTSRASKGTSTHQNPSSVDPDPETEEYPEPGLPTLPTTPRNARAIAGRVSASMNPDQLHLLDRTPTRKMINEYRAEGARFENWMANANLAEPRCPVVQATVTMFNLTNADAPNEPEFHVWDSESVVPPKEIRDGLESTNLPKDRRRKTWIRTKLHRNKLINVSDYEHYIVPGAIVASNIYRRNRGTHWADIAIALYKDVAAIDTLRYVFYATVENVETLPLVGRVLYPNNNLPGPKSKASPPPIETWYLGTPGFREILGSQLGRATARLVLAAWPRGTHQIPRIHTWFMSGDLHMRFDIEPTVQGGKAGRKPSLFDSPTGKGKEKGKKPGSFDSTGKGKGKERRSS